MKKLGILLTLTMVLFSCKKEEITIGKDQKSIYAENLIRNNYSTQSTTIEECLEENQRIINGIIKKYTEYGGFKKSLGFYYHNKTKDSFIAIYNELINRNIVYESSYGEINVLPLYTTRKYDIIDSLNLIWKEKELLINKEVQDSIQNEIKRRTDFGEIKECNKDVYNPNTGNK
jgi:hypothetical protein